MCEILWNLLCEKGLIHCFYISSGCDVIISANCVKKSFRGLRREKVSSTRFLSLQVWSGRSSLGSVQRRSSQVRPLPRHRLGWRPLLHVPGARLELGGGQSSVPRLRGGGRHGPLRQSSTQRYEPLKFWRRGMKKVTAVIVLLHFTNSWTFSPLDRDD